MTVPSHSDQKPTSRNTTDVRKVASRGLRSASILILSVATCAVLTAWAQNVQRGEWEDVLKIVAADVQKNFYDEHLKGLDWAALTEDTRQRIRNSNNTGQMILAICALLDKLQDSHTYFIPPQLTQLSDFGFKAKPYGNNILVHEVVNKGPAAKAGLDVGDKLISLNGIPVDRNNIAKILWVLERVVPATFLDAQVLRAGSQRPQAIHIAARMILTQEHQYLDSVWRVEDKQYALDYHPTFPQKDYGDGITYVSIPTFVASPDSAYSAIKKAEHSLALIVDLRGNHGGRVDTELAFLGFFTKQARVLAKRISRSQAEEVTIAPKYSGFSGSILVLVDSDSTSAAEEAARHLQMTYKAQVIGDRTSGKVNEGRYIPEKIGARFVMPFGVVVTQAKLVMPDGVELEGRGVIPDSECIPAVEDLRQQHDLCLDQAVALAKNLVRAKEAGAN